MKQKQEKEKRNRYTLDERMTALEVLKQNNYDYQKTESQLGIGRSTLAKWNSIYRSKIESDKQIIEAARVAQMDFRSYKLKFLSGHFGDLERVAKKAINRAETLLDKANSLRDVAKVLEVLYNYVEKLTNDESPQQQAPLNNARQQINILNNIQPIVKPS